MITIKWLGWANFLVKTEEKTICFDPYFKLDEKVDLILISHNHPDHCNLEVINSLKKWNPVIIANKETAEKISEAEIIEISETKEINGIRVEAVYAYNLNIPNHQKGKDLGLIVEIENKKIYHAGDTDFIEEMKEIRDIDLALLPIGGTYTMDINQAVEAAKVIQPKIIIPMHFGNIAIEVEGKKQQIELKVDVNEFKNKVESQTKSKVIILSSGEEYTLK